MKHDKKTCGCFFCSMRCPRCGGDNIQVDYYTRFSMVNDEPNAICVNQYEDIAKYSCTDCDGDEVFTEELSDLFTFDERDEDNDLAILIEAALGLSSVRVRIDEKGNITRELSGDMVFEVESDD